MREYLKFYIDGQWVDPAEPKTLDVDNPTTEQVSGKIAIGTAADVDKAVKAARKAFAALRVVGQHPRGAAGPAAGDRRGVSEAFCKISPMRCTRRWAHRPRWQPARR